MWWAGKKSNGFIILQGKSGPVALSSCLKQLLAIGESYPDNIWTLLVATKALGLSNSFSETED